MKAVRELNGQGLVEELARSASATAILFYGTEHLRSETVRRSFGDVAREHAESVRFFTINVDENPSVATAQSIKLLPAIILYVGGKEVARRGGPQGIQEITQLIDRREDKPR